MLPKENYGRGTKTSSADLEALNDNIEELSGTVEELQKRCYALCKYVAFRKAFIRNDKLITSVVKALSGLENRNTPSHNTRVVDDATQLGIIDNSNMKFADYAKLGMSQMDAKKLHAMIFARKDYAPIKRVRLSSKVNLRLFEDSEKAAKIAKIFPGFTWETSTGDIPLESFGSLPESNVDTFVKMFIDLKTSGIFRFVQELEASNGEQEWEYIDHCNHADHLVYLERTCIPDLSKESL